MEENMWGRGEGLATEWHGRLLAGVVKAWWQGRASRGFIMRVCITVKAWMGTCNKKNSRESILLERLSRGHHLISSSKGGGGWTWDWKSLDGVGRGTCDRKKNNFMHRKEITKRELAQLKEKVIVTWAHEQEGQRDGLILWHGGRGG